MPRELPANICPICKLEPTEIARNYNCTSTCPNGHVWHICYVHKVIVPTDTPEGPTTKCTCGKGDRRKQADIANLNTEQVMEVLKNMHNPEEWAFFEEMRIGTGFGKDAEQRLDGWAIHYYPSKKNVARCYEVKVSRSDFYHEINKPTKRRAGLRLSNEFYFVTPRNMVRIEEVPPESGLLEVSEDGSISTTIKAPYRDTIPPTWLFMAAVCRRIDKPRLNDWLAIKAEDDRLKARGEVFLRVLKEHLDRWRNFNQGNKEIPDKIAEALEQLYFDAEESIKENIIIKDIMRM